MFRIGKYTIIFISLLWAVFGYASKPPLEPNWGACDPHSTATIDHRPWQFLLHKYLVKDTKNNKDVNLFHYALVSSADKKKLHNYLDYLQSLNIQHYNRQEQLAYWINLYNAQTVKLIISHFPADSVTSIGLSHSPFYIGPFSAKTLNVLGYGLSLRDINNRILHKFWHDQRIIFALSMGALGSPNLRQHAYRSDNLERMLDYAAFDFVNSEHGVTVKDHRLSVSKLFIWFKAADFDSNDAGIIRFIQCYAKPKLYRQLNEISYISDSYFNWGING